MKKADNQMNTIGKTPEEQFLFPQSKSALEERETEKSKRTKLFALFLQQQQQKTTQQKEEEEERIEMVYLFDWLAAADHG